MRDKPKRVADWLPAIDAVLSIADHVGGEKSAQDLIANWIGEGKLPTRVGALERFPNDTGNWGDDDLPPSEALRMRFVKPTLPGMLRYRFELNEAFWNQSLDWEADYACWDWDRGDFVVGYRQSADDPDKATYWLAKHVNVKRRPLETLTRLWIGSQPSPELPSDRTPAPKRAGRHEDPRRADWTGELVLMVRENAIPHLITANELIERIENRLIIKGIWDGPGAGSVKAFDRTTVYKSAQRVIEVLNGPQVI